jgi:predicted lipoprotein
MKKFTKTLLASIICGAFVVSCGGGGSNSTPTTPTPVTPVDNSFSYDASELITNVTTDIIVSGYQALALNALALHQATLTLLNNPSDENLAAAQQAWKNARSPWEQGEAHIFGPVDALSIDPHLDSWPLNTLDLQTLLDTQSGFDATTIQSWNDDVQGFHTMEFLLFGDGVANNQKAITAMSDKEREYLVATAEVFLGYANSLHDAWTVASDPNDATSAPYQSYLLSPDNAIYSSQVAVVQELINGMIGIVDEVGNGKIGEPFATSIATADTSIVESQYSWNSLDDFTNNIWGVQTVYRGETPNGVDKTGIIDFVNAANPALATRVEQEISTAIAAIVAIAGDNNLPFRQAISDEAARVRIQTAIDALSVLQTSLESDVLTLLTDWQTS